MSRTVDPTEIRDTTDRLAHQLDPPRPGVLCAGDARRAGHPGGADRTARARAQDPGRRPRRGVRGVAGRRRPDRSGLAGPPDRHLQGRCGAAGRDRPAARSPPRGRRGGRPGRAVREAGRGHRRRGGRGSGGPAAAARPRRRTGRCGSCRTSAAAPASTPSPTPRPPTAGPMPSGPAGSGPTPTGSPGTCTSRGPWRRWRGSTTPSATAPTASSARPGPRAGANRRRPTPTTPPPSS